MNESDRHRLGESLLRRLVDETGADMGYFHLGGSVRLITGSDDVDWSADADYWRVNTWRNIPAEAAYVGRVPFVFHSSTSDRQTRRVLTEAPTPLESVLSVPAVDSGGNVVGGLDLCARRHRQWSRSDMSASEITCRWLFMWFEWESGVAAVVATGDQRERRARALTAAASVLLARRGVDAVQAAIDALMSATDAGLGWVERNSVDPRLGLVTSVVCRSPAGHDLDRDRWDRVAWSSLPDSWAVLSTGVSQVQRIPQLTGVEAETYAGSWIGSELDVPIFSKGAWVGMLGLADRQVNRNWEADRAMAEIAASMIGAFWANQRFEAELEERATRERALARCARLLLGDEEAAIDRALEAVAEAMGADRCVLEKNEWEAARGLHVRVVTSVPAGKDAGVVSPRDRQSWSSMPEAFRVLADGKVLTVEANEGDSTNHPGGAREMIAPIMVRHGWKGLVAVARGDDRPWLDEEQAFLEAVAAAIGAYWDRQETVEELREVVDSKDRFLSAVSHEVRTPLTAVVGLAALLKTSLDDHPDEMVRELASLIAEQGSEMTNIIEDLLVAGRMEIDAISVLAETVDLYRETELALRGVNGAEKIDVEKRSVMAVADPVRVRQIIRNLAANALRYGGEKVVVVLAEPDPVTALFSIGDDGVGVRSVDTVRIFEPYQRAGDAPSSAGSVGIGLAVSRHLARKMGGDLVYRRSRNWTWFDLTLPSPAASGSS